MRIDEHLHRAAGIAGASSFVARGRPQSALLQIANIAGEIHTRSHRCGYRMISRHRLGSCLRADGNPTVD